jgi:tetratricopeptide (TPR) repeat protein
MHGLAASYDFVGRRADALPLHEETLALRRARLGPDHPDTLWSMNNLAATYSATGRRTDALELFEEVLARRIAKLGRDHPDTIASMNNVAHVHASLGRHAEALELRQETLALWTAKLGPDHPFTLMSMSNLALGYAALGRHAEALKLREETLALRRVKLGPDHPHTLVSMRDLAESLVQLDRGAEAVPLIDECVERAAGKDVDPRLIPTVMESRLRHFEKSQDAAGCRATAEMWEKLKRTDAASLYNAACKRAVTAAVIQADPRTPAADATRLAGEEADRAMAWIEKAVAAGYKNAAHLARDRDLDALRERADFRELVAELEAGK